MNYDEDIQNTESSENSEGIESTEEIVDAEDEIIGHEECSILDDSNFDKSTEDQALGLDAIVGSKMIFYERLPMLEVVSDRLIRLLSGSLRNFTSENVGVSFASLTSVRFGDYLKSIKNPCILNVFFAHDWGGHGLVAIDNDLAYIMIDVLLGGREGISPLSLDGRQFTTIECNLISKLIDLFLSDLKSAFDPISPITFISERLETNAAFASIVRPTNAVILVRLSVDINDRGGFIELVFPYATLEPIREVLLQNFMGEKFGRDSIWEDHLIHQFMQTHMDVSATLETTSLPLQDVLDWKVGSQIFLTATPESSVKLVCGDYPLFIGKMGQKSGNMAVKIETSLATERDVNHDSVC